VPEGELSEIARRDVERNRKDYINADLHRYRGLGATGNSGGKEEVPGKNKQNHQCGVYRVTDGHF
jgi:hypothetical protein